MENSIKVFEHEQFGSVRTVEINGEAWLVGKDVANVLGYTNPQKAIRDHVDEDDRTVNESFTVNGTAVSLVNESGFYSLVMSSKMPKAKEFKRWVTSEVLPSIRKHGMYAADELLNNPEFLLKTAMKLKEEHDERVRLEGVVVGQAKLIEEQTPKAVFADAVAASSASILVRDLAKLLRQNGVDIGQNRLYRWMRENKYIMRNELKPTQMAMDLGLFELKEYVITSGDKKPITGFTVKVTGKGQQYFINKFLGRNKNNV